MKNSGGPPGQRDERYTLGELPVFSLSSQQCIRYITDSLRHNTLLNLLICPSEPCNKLSSIIWNNMYSYLGSDSCKMDLRYSQVKPLHANVLLQLIGLVVQAGLQTPNKETQESLPLPYTKSSST